MKYKKIVRLYSNSRVAKYYRATSGDKNKAVMLYFANMKIAQAFHPLLSSFEVILRNQLHYALAHHFSDGNWIINQKNGFMVASSLTHTNKRTKKQVTNRYLLTEVQKAEKKISDRGARITAGRVIAEQTLGFWNSFYEVHHYYYYPVSLVPYLRNCLPDMDGNKSMMLSHKFVNWGIALIIMSLFAL